MEHILLYFLGTEVLSLPESRNEEKGQCEVSDMNKQMNIELLSLSQVYLLPLYISPSPLLYIQITQIMAYLYY